MLIDYEVVFCIFFPNLMLLSSLATCEPQKETGLTFHEILIV